MVVGTRNPVLADPGRVRGDRTLADLGGREAGLNLRVLTWNLFHGRDAPPGKFERGLDWRLGGRPLRCGDYVLVNRSLEDEFIRVLRDLEWDAALLQEVPPSWSGPLAEATGATGSFAPTSRNWMRPVTGSLWARRPHLIGSWEGGGNLILVRDGIELEPGSQGRRLLTGLPERRVVQSVRLTGGVDLYNLHASTGHGRAVGDVLKAATFAVGRSDSRPLVLGGDFNCRPSGGRPVPERAARFGLSEPPSGMSGSIDHLLVRGLEVVEPPRLIPDRSREVADMESGALIRLSDHPPVIGLFRA
ncbi:MAG: endonuclease/exonuclease/phosphatase family protein [Solirubrobacterales bacterium]